MTTTTTILATTTTRVVTTTGGSRRSESSSSTRSDDDDDDDDALEKKKRRRRPRTRRKKKNKSGCGAPSRRRRSSSHCTPTRRPRRPCASRRRAGCRSPWCPAASSPRGSLRDASSGASTPQIGGVPCARPRPSCGTSSSAPSRSAPTTPRRPRSTWRDATPSSTRTGEEARWCTVFVLVFRLQTRGPRSSTRRSWPACAGSSTSWTTSRSGGRRVRCS
mmetsp:Transcript_23998/g.95235  ORF Transcript_23998/g.95235 Transcript_23998/m.95235 type:complete len:219 (+) Transcript_23998:125-781(+)